MSVRRLVLPALLAAALLVAIVAFFSLPSAQPARALPPAGTDNVSASADVHVTSRTGSETIHLTGTASIQRQDPHMDGGVEVVSDAISALNLSGTSLTGAVHVVQSPDTASTGEIRSLQPSPPQFPASSFFDVFFEATIPVSGSRSAPTLHNEVAIHLAPASSISAWPPFGVEFRAEPQAPGTYCDPNGVVPGPGGIPILPPPGVVDPAPGSVEAAHICVTKVSVVMGLPPTPTPTATPCVPTCTPVPTVVPATATSTRTPRPTVTATWTPIPTLNLPKNPTFSVAAGGPSGLPPAALLALGSGSTVIAVSGNDNFAGAWPVGGVPFTGSENTGGMTVQTGEPLTIAPASPPPGYCIAVAPNTKGATVWFKFTASSSGTLNADTIGSDFDTVLAAYTGSALDALTQAACNDDSGAGLQSSVSFAVTAGTTYYFQVGGFTYVDGAATGQLRFHMEMSGGAGSVGVHVAVSCGHLGLSSDGCNGSLGHQDDIDGLSFGNDFRVGTQPIFFSVGPGSMGVSGSGVAQQAACTPAEGPADEFASSRNGTNFLFLGGDGGGGTCPRGSGIGLIERPTSDNLDAITGQPPSAVDTDGDGVPDNPVFFTLTPGSPSLAILGRRPADILWTVGGFLPGVYAAAEQLGLQPTDAIDALCIADHGSSGIYEPAVDRVQFSLAPGSPTLAAIGASPADVLGPGPEVLIHAADLGLRATDNVDALQCYDTSGGQKVTVQVGDIWFCDAAQSGHTCDTIIHVGDTVTWDFSGASLPHTTTECGLTCSSPVPKDQALWNSGVIDTTSSPRTFQRTFITNGIFLYYCQLHGTGQLGRIIVVGAAGSPTPTASRTPTPTSTPAERNGDANKDGRVDAVDAALMLQYGAGLLHTINASSDVNHDGRTDAIDAALTLQYIAGFLTSLP